MRSSVRLVLIISACAMLVGLSADAHAQGWLQSYNGSGDSTDVAYGIFVDDVGNVYVTGLTWNSNGDYDVTTLKYGPDGSMIWVRDYDGPINYTDWGRDVEVDAAGNVYVLASSMGTGGNLDLLTLKYASDGTLLWEERFDARNGGTEWARSLRMDSAGDIFVAATSDSLPENGDYILVKYDSDGNLIWDRQYDGTAGGDDRMYEMVLDASGNAIISGQSWNDARSWDYLVLKYDSDGNLLWDEYYNGPENLYDYGSDMQVDDAGNVYVTGLSWGGASRYDYTTLKYDPLGNLLWERRYDGPSGQDDLAYGVWVDTAGWVYVTGESEDAVSYVDCATVKYDTAGNLIWARRYDGSSDGWEGAYEVRSDAAGNVYVGGWSEPGDAAIDYTVLKYDVDGNLGWVFSYNGTANRNDWIEDLMLDASGNVYTTGRSWESRGGVDFDYLTMKLIPCPEGLRGDVDCDGTTDLTDVVLLGNTIDGLLDPTGTCGECTADYDGDGDIDETDYDLLYDQVGGTGSPPALTGGSRVPGTDRVGAGTSVPGLPPGISQQRPGPGDRIPIPAEP